MCGRRRRRGVRAGPCDEGLLRSRPGYFVVTPDEMVRRRRSAHPPCVPGCVSGVVAYSHESPDGQE
ncbi:hypothetical protein ACFOLD_11975 [Kocuria carniphila]|uniref:hypothetical protein n=1 Tax=Kocuria carniphila TaxID=262208 RepID=UPI00360C8BF0